MPFAGPCSYIKRCSRTRFPVDGTAAQVYARGWLSALGIGRSNQALAAVNLSEGGVLVRTTGRFKSGTRVQVRLEIEKFNDVIEAEGVVCWCFQSAQDSSEHFAGIRFTRIAGPAASKIASLRGYFTSPEIRQRSAARRRQNPIGFPV